MNSCPMHWKQVCDVLQIIYLEFDIFQTVFYFSTLLWKYVLMHFNLKQDGMFNISKVNSLYGVTYAQ